MKKKIKNFTKNEIENICDNHPLCNGCPFASSDRGIFGCFAIDTELWGELEINYED